MWRRIGSMLGATAALVLLAGCHEDMWNQPKIRAMEPNSFFPDGQSMRPLVPNTVDQTHFWTDEGRYTGYVGTHMVGNRMVLGHLVTEFPFPITMADLKRGQERFDIYCSPCHGELGNGQGMIAQRGLALRRPPASYDTDRLRKMPIGHFYDVITNGYGVMYSYASRVEPDDRWRIVAYIRALQRAAHGNPSDLPPGMNPNTLPTGAPGVPPINPTTPAAGTQFPAGTAAGSMGNAPAGGAPARPQETTAPPEATGTTPGTGIGTKPPAASNLPQRNPSAPNGVGINGQ
jgi:hypothetical protein